ncbi:hypothetical protein GGS24DRAFT_496206 [Hypoxylon argillaceum]|nr:hypothetical protein GGS24DRAFT_496206 [Hypoxylon argillaceum]
MPKDSSKGIVGEHIIDLDGYLDRVAESIENIPTLTDDQVQVICESVSPLVGQQITENLRWSVDDVETIQQISAQASAMLGEDPGIETAQKLYKMCLRKWHRFPAEIICPGTGLVFAPDDTPDPQEGLTNMAWGRLFNSALTNIVVHAAWSNKFYLMVYAIRFVCICNSRDSRPWDLEAYGDPFFEAFLECQGEKPDVPKPELLGDIAQKLQERGQWPSRTYQIFHSIASTRQLQPGGRRRNVNYRPGRYDLLTVRTRHLTSLATALDMVAEDGTIVFLPSALQVLLFTHARAGGARHSKDQPADKAAYQKLRKEAFIGLEANAAAFGLARDKAQTVFQDVPRHARVLWDEADKPKPDISQRPSTKGSSRVITLVRKLAPTRNSKRSRKEVSDNDDDDDEDDDDGDAPQHPTTSKRPRVEKRQQMPSTSMGKQPQRYTGIYEDVEDVEDAYGISSTYVAPQMHTMQGTGRRPLSRQVSRAEEQQSRLSSSTYSRPPHQQSLGGGGFSQTLQHRFANSTRGERGSGIQPMPTTSYREATSSQESFVAPRLFCPPSTEGTDGGSNTNYSFQDPFDIEGLLDSEPDITAIGSLQPIPPFQVPGLGLLNDQTRNTGAAPATASQQIPQHPPLPASDSVIDSEATRTEGAVATRIEETAATRTEEAVAAASGQEPIQSAEPSDKPGQEDSESEPSEFQFPVDTYEP